MNETSGPASPLPEGRADGRGAVSESAHYAQGYRNGYEAALQGDVSPFCECGHYATHHRSTGCKWCDCTRMTYRTAQEGHDLPDPASESLTDKLARWRRDDPAWWATYDETRATTRHCPDPTAHVAVPEAGEHGRVTPYVRPTCGNLDCRKCYPAAPVVGEREEKP